MLIQKIELYEQEVVLNGAGEYDVIKKNAQVVPAMITNRALNRGHQLGILKGSLLSDLFAFAGALEGQDLSGKKEGEEVQVSPEAAMKLAPIIDEEKMIAVVYIACIGANKNFPYSFDDFLDLYHADQVEVMQTYVALLSGLKSNDPNKFAAEFKKTTAASKGKK